MRLCVFCRQPNLRHPNSRYCSVECKSRAYSERKRQARHEGLEGRACDQCGEPIPDGKPPSARFCSGSCGIKWADARYSAERSAQRRAARSGRTCLTCLGPVSDDLRIGTVYCSEKCREEGNRPGKRAKGPDYMRRYLYGITPEQWQAQLEAQGHRCAICRREDWGGKHGVPHADHCHETDRFRGILCDWCNRGIGQFFDDPALLRAAADYLEAATAA